MVHFNYLHLTRSKKLEDHIQGSLDKIISSNAPVSQIHCFLSRSFDNRDRLISNLKMQVRLNSSDSFVLEKSASSFKTAYKHLSEDLQHLLSQNSSPGPNLASA